MKKGEFEKLTKKIEEQIIGPLNEKTNNQYGYSMDFDCMPENLEHKGSDFKMKGFIILITPSSRHKRDVVIFFNEEDQRFYFVPHTSDNGSVYPSVDDEDMPAARYSLKQMVVKIDEIAEGITVWCEKAYLPTSLMYSIE